MRDTSARRDARVDPPRLRGRRLLSGARGLFALAALACATGCASDWGSLRGRARDADLDVGDAAKDQPDAAPDAMRDAGPEGGADVASDARDDARMDAPSDVRVDASSDVIADVRLDAPVDVPADVRPDVTVDVGADARVDAPVDVAVVPRCRPTIDGLIASDWTASAALASNATPTAWGLGMNELRAVRVCVDDAALYLGVDGIVEGTNAILAFIDRDDGAATGITSGAAFADRAGMLDGAISSHFMPFPSGVGVDMVWGTRGMSTHHGAVIDNAGLRDVRSNPADYGWIAGDDTVCTGAAGGACEVSIPWSALYGASGRPAGARLSIFLRLGNGDGSMASNQTLPQDAPTTPFVVTRVLRVETGP